ncbi:hypothetical protein HNR59_001953 [Aquamicrobium lusatiense]|uniref:DUF982 domain-containing protein n=1 Tax=Aquamicrobium lusatiense TaxID=89772 RepID=A0A7W9S3Z4_9HYPH|nr:hypothetical protein [Aquamicrobium lusatiense]
MKADAASPYSHRIGRNGEKQMDRLQFSVPVRLSLKDGQPVEEIYCVDQALAFLQNWPVGRQGPLFQAAFDACFGASVDVVSTEEARKAFAAFCRVSDLLAKDAVLSDRGGEEHRIRPA